MILSPISVGAYNNNWGRFQTITPSSGEGANGANAAAVNKSSSPSNQSVNQNGKPLSGAKINTSPGKSVSKGECETCQNRKYVDGSNDPGVSFKTPTTLSPGKAASAVKSHESEHVSRERAKAQQEGREIVSQSVRIFTDVCPECGDTYVSGGVTETVTQSAPKNQFSNFLKNLYQANSLARSVTGANVDLVA